jgi:hypothetical protein
MTPVETRHIHKSSWRCQDDVRELLQATFVAELIFPSRCVWLVSPWVSDIPVIDNGSSAFDALDPTWGPRGVRLTEVLSALMRRGTTVVLATRPVDHNAPFVAKLKVAAAASSSALVVHEAEELHEKGLLGDDFYLSGSMNLTFGGVELLEETVKYDTSETVVAEAQLTFHGRWGGRLRGAPA